MQIKKRQKPDWLKIKLPSTNQYAQIKKFLSERNLHTICESGACPNFGECWDSGNATFMILGDICTRACEFCNVTTGKPLPPDESEPERIAEAVDFMQLKHCVLTSVDRDDMPDGGANIWAATVNAIRAKCPKTTIETLIPDFQGKKELLDIIIKVHPNIVAHNLETVERLTKEVRKQFIYFRSLEVLKYLADNNMRTKSGIMLGLGETEEEIIQVMNDLIKVKCKILTIGQYLQPTPKHLTVKEYVHPDTFANYKKIGLEMGFEYLESAPLVRSSYHADRQV